MFFARISQLWNAVWLIAIPFIVQGHVWSALMAPKAGALRPRIESKAAQDTVNVGGFVVLMCESVTTAREPQPSCNLPKRPTLACTSRLGGSVHLLPATTALTHEIAIPMNVDRLPNPVITFYAIVGCVAMRNIQRAEMEARPAVVA